MNCKNKHQTNKVSIATGPKQPAIIFLIFFVNKFVNVKLEYLHNDIFEKNLTFTHQKKNFQSLFSFSQIVMKLKFGHFIRALGRDWIWNP